MNEFDSCVHNIIKQIYPVLAYEYEMGLTESRGDSSGIYSFQFLKSLHENSMENIHKILKKSDDATSRKDFDKPEKKILLEFFTYLNEKKSKLSQQWLSFQHYMHYIYRNLTSSVPQVYNREISEYFIVEMKSLVKILSEVDEIQLYLRVFSILREYVTFAYWQFLKQTNQVPAIERIYQCYKTFLLASKHIYPVFIELEKLLKEKCNMTWMDYNKFLFFNYFYEAIDSEILIKLEQEGKLDLPEDYNPMMLDFGELNTLSLTLKNLRGINENMDKEMSEDHKQILRKNFWICRKTEEKQSVQRLAAELIILASERRNRGTEPLLDKDGQCLCEDCLIFKLACIVESVESSNTIPYMRMSPCRYCSETVELNNLHDHVVDHLKNIAVSENTTSFNKSVENHDGVRKQQQIAKTEREMSQCLINLLKKNKTAVESPCFKKETSNGCCDKMKADKVIANNVSDIKDTSSCRASSVKNDGNKSFSPCTHSCKHEEELKAELKKLQGVCEHHKDLKRCDCTYCEVFGNTVANHLHKSNETRNRLRIRLNQRKQKMVSKNPLIDKTNKPTQQRAPAVVKTAAATAPANVEVSSQPENVPPAKPTAVVNTVQKSASSGVNKDIHGLVDFIEGNSGSDKVAIAEKKAAKKARQRQKKDEEKRQQEEEEDRKEEERRREEEIKLRLLKHLEKERNAANEVNKKLLKKQKNKEKSGKSEQEKLIEETIPAMLTIHRSVENGENKPTVTITLKGSTPDQDNLLYTLVNGTTTNNEDKNHSTSKSKKNKNKVNNNKPLLEQKIEHFVKLQVLQKDAGKGNNGKSNDSCEREVKVSFTVNKNSNNNPTDKNKPNNINNNKNIASEKNYSKKQVKAENRKNGELDLPFLRLPPGITITKVDGPLSNKNFKVTMNGLDNSGGGNIPVNTKSGVIVVDTEKLIQTNGEQKESSNNRKNKKKKNKKQQISNGINSQPSMITLKNPVFKSLKESVNRESPMPVDIAGASCGQASIFKNENGMVTIRSSRLQQSLSNGVPVHNLLSDLRPVMGKEVNGTGTNGCSLTDGGTINSFNAQEILSGLPGIEITKVDKKNPRPDHESKSCQVAQVSIIPTNGEKCSIDKDDWIYDNIFTPKDVLEDELDAEERELEAFKRFCQQSIPPKQKEKVAHLNVKDIVFKKKSDINTV